MCLDEMLELLKLQEGSTLMRNIWLQATSSQPFALTLPNRIIMSALWLGDCCQGDGARQPKQLVGVTSSPGLAERKALVRQRWGKGFVPDQENGKNNFPNGLSVVN